MSKDLNSKLVGIATKAVTSQQSIRDQRGTGAKILDAATNKSYATEDKRIAQEALRKFENDVWKPKMAAHLEAGLAKQGIKKGSPKYQESYDYLYSQNYRKLQLAKQAAQREIGLLQKPTQTQRDLDNDYKYKESKRNDTQKTQMVARALRDSAETVGGGLATGFSRTARAVLQTAADIGENDDGGIFDRGAKALEGYEKNLTKVYPGYKDTQENGSFVEKLSLGAIENIPQIIALGGAAGGVSKAAQLAGASSKVAALSAYGATSAAIYPMAYLDGNDSVKDELENATADQLKSAKVSQDIYKSKFDSNIKAGLSETDAYAKARDQTISELAEKGGKNVGLATLAISFLAPGIGSQVAQRAGGGTLTKAGQKAFNKLAVAADSSKVARYAIPAASVGVVAGLNAVEEGLQEGYTDYVAQKTAVDVGVKDEIDVEQNKEVILLGATLGGLFGGAMHATGSSGLRDGQARLRESQENYAAGVQQSLLQREQLASTQPGTPEYVQAVESLRQTQTQLDAMKADAKSVGIPFNSLSRRAPRIDPIDGVDVDSLMGNQDQDPAADPQPADDAVQNPSDSPASTPTPIIMSEKEQDAQDEQIAALIAEQRLLDATIEDGSNERTLDESIQAANSWYDQKRGVGATGLSGVVQRAASADSDVELENKKAQGAATRTSINDYIQSQRAEQRLLDRQADEALEDAITAKEKAAAEALIQQREAMREQENEILARRELLAQPYDTDTQDWTVTGADGAPFHLGRLWNENLSPAQRVKAIDDASQGELDQNLSKADWQALPEGVQKTLHSFMGDALATVRANREQQASAQPQPQVETGSNPFSLRDSLDASVVNEATPYTVEDLRSDIVLSGADTSTVEDIKTKARAAGLPDTEIESAISEVIDQDATWAQEPVAEASPVNESSDVQQLTEQNPVINIPAPGTRSKAAPVSEAQTRQLQGDPVSEASAVSDVDADRLAANSIIATDKKGDAKWFATDAKAQDFIAKKYIGDTHEVVIGTVGKRERFQILPKSPAPAKSVEPNNATIESTQEAPLIINRETARPAKQTALPEAQKGAQVRDIGDDMTDKGGRTHKLVSIDWNSSGGIDSVRTQYYSPADGKYKTITSRSNGEFNRMFGDVGLDHLRPQQDKESPAPAKQPAVESKVQFADNKLFTPDKVAAARARLKSKLGQANSGLDPEILIDGVTVAGAYVESGVRKFGDYAKLMLEDFGTDIKPYLLMFWNGVRDYPGFDSTGMTDEVKSRAEFNELMKELVAPAKSKHPETIGSGDNIDTFVGENEDGLPLYEDKNGVRAINEQGIFIRESVAITPDGLQKTERRDRYLTTEELTQKEADNDTRTSSQDNQPSVERGLPAADQEIAERGDAGRAKAKPDVNVDAVNGSRDGSNLSSRDGDTRPRATDESANADDSDSQPSSARSSDGAIKAADSQTQLKAANYEVVPELNETKRSWFDTAKNNVFIVELLKTLDEQGRTATPAEQEFLSGYTGWGASEIANGMFPNPTTGEYKSTKWQDLGEKLKSLLSESEYDTARRTTQYAHYTPPVLVSGIYKALEQFGFAGGTVLEPASGIGVFNGLMPRHMASASQYVGIELDPTTGRIAQHLYPKSEMRIADFIETKLPKDHFDAAIGNPPFANITTSYGTGKGRVKLQLHDFFFAKTLDSLKPGAVMAFVTSKGTMDKKGDTTRKLFAKQADLIGAIRLPQTAFKENAGTEVVTDIIFLRKRLDGEAASDTAWSNVKSITIDGQETSINEYYVNNPDMVLGNNAIKSSQYGPAYTVTPKKGDFKSQLDNAIARLPSNIYNPAQGSKAEAAKVMEADYGVSSSTQKEGGVYLKDGALMRVEDGVGKPLTQRYTTSGTLTDLTDKDIAFLSDYTKVRDALKQSQRDQLQDSPNWEQSLADLNKVYKAFVKEHGRLMAHTISESVNDEGRVTVTKRFTNKARLMLDAEGALASVLESIEDGLQGKNKGVVVDGSYLKGRSLRTPKVPTIKTTQDALIYVLDSEGRPDIKRISELVNKTEADVITDLGDQLYSNPETNEQELAETYLAGNVVKKLAAAEARAKTDPSFQRNVTALREVQPKPIAPNDIASNLGSAWIPGRVISNFATEILNANINASYSPRVGLWDVSGNSRSSDYQTPDKSTVELMNSILNGSKIVVSRSIGNGESVIDVAASELANQVAKNIKSEFKNWLWTDEARAEELAEYYNKNYNNIVPAKFNGDHLTLSGMSNKIQLRPHQKTGIYRVISQGDVYLNHAVGAGKTFTMIAAAMEEKRLGLIKKPMFVVPNHMLEQFSQEFLMLYPAANIMVADEANFKAYNRKQFVAQAAFNNPDAIVITHSAFKRIGVKPETEEAFLKAELEHWRESLDDQKQSKADSSRTSVKQMERNIQSMEEKLKKLVNTDQKDDVVYFEDTGVDKLYVDELHEFRKLSYVTKKGNIKGIDPKGSQMATDLNIKLDLMRKDGSTRTLVGASGTPITNTMGELYSVQRYFQSEQLASDGLDHFDAWANQFGEVVEGLEQNAAGNYEVVPRFAKFVNVPELMSRVRSFMDVLTSQDLGDVVKRPDVKGGGRQIKAIPTPDGFADYQQTLSDRIDAIRKRSGKSEKGDDIILSVIGDGRFSAIDMRFVDPDLPSDPNSKLNIAISDMVEAYHSTASNEYTTDGKIDADKGGALMMFTDIGLGEQSAASRGFDMKAWITSELVRQGVDPNHIAFMRDNKSHAKKGKLFDDLRQGKKRILIGGKDMETGVNAQKRLTHLFHLDAPWFPASVEQREGRIIRQGNQNKEVSIIAYATKGSYDSTMWGMVARKARFIEQAMSGDTTMRHMDDVSQSSDFEQASALSSGDPRALQLAGLRQDVDRLNRLYSAYQNTKLVNQSKVKQSRQQLARANKELGEIDALLPSHKTIAAGDVIGQVGNKSFDNRKDYGQAIIDAFEKLAKENTVGEFVLGSAAGYDVVYNGVPLKGGHFLADADINIPKADDKVLFDSHNVVDVRPEGLTTRIINRIDGLASYKAKVESFIAQTDTDIKNYDRRIAKSFDEQTELNEKTADLIELEEALTAEAEQLKALSNGSANHLTDEDRVPEKAQYSKAEPQTEAIRKQYEGTDQWMKAPNGSDTNLTEQQWLQVRTPAFKEWFGDWENDPDNASKVIDDNGEPMVVYHGTNANFTEFEDSRSGKNHDFLEDSGAFFFTADKGNAEFYADEFYDEDSEANIMPLFISIMDPLVIDGRESKKKGRNAENAFDPNSDDYLNEMRQDRNDGIIVYGNTGTEDIMYVIEDASSVKSATNNAGTFDYSNPDIRYSKTNPAQGVTGTTPKHLIAALQKRFGKDLIAKLIKSGKLRVRTLNDFVSEDGRLLIPTDAEGLYRNGKVTLISDNLTDATIVPTFIHEMGGHAGIQNVLSENDYIKLMKAFDRMVDSGNTLAIAAKVRAESATNSEDDAKGEYIPYLLTAQSAAAQSDTAIKRFVKQAVAAVRSWLRSAGVNIVVNPNDIQQLAERMIKRLAKQNTDALIINDESVDPQYSRRYSELGEDTRPTTAKGKAVEAAKLTGSAAMSAKYYANLLLRRHLATPQHVALLNPSFKKFTDNVQGRIAYENNEAGKMQTWLPEIWDTRLRVGKRKEALDKVSRAIFDGTMADQVWTDDELQTKFNLNDNEIDLYKRTRAAIDSSVKAMTVDTLSSLAKGTKLVNIHTVNRLKLQNLNPEAHMAALQQLMVDELQVLVASGNLSSAAEARMQNHLDAVFDVMQSIAVKFDALVEQGYAPLMRFGEYAVEVRNKTTNELDLFELYESKGDQTNAIKTLKKKYDLNQFEVGTGVLNPEAFKQFTGKGLSPETVQLFASELGLDEDGAVQAYLKVAVSDRSALKRLIHRKKVPGYSEDMPRVLSSFVMSNARYSGRSLYNGEIERSIQEIKDGHLQNEAQKVFDNMENPQEEFATARSMMFHYYMGFSFAFLTLNLTQPLTQTIPKLTAYVGAAQAHKDMVHALGIVNKYMGKAAINTAREKMGATLPINWKGFENNLPQWVEREDYLRMSREGHLDPQNIWMIRGLERGKDSVIGGVWGNIERAAGWPAEISESINRRSTMIAAFKAAKTMGDVKLKQKGFDSAYDFAVSVIQQTQGIYNKGNRSGLARGNGKLGQYGPLIMVFKQFTINYTEQMIRHARDRELKSLAVALTWQFMMAGALGLPFTDDLRDLIEGLMFRIFGKSVNLVTFLEDELGKENADAMMYGLVSQKSPVDFYGRSSLGNLLPGTDFFRPQEGDWMEILGASSGFFENFFVAAQNATKGQYKDAVLGAAPRYVRDAASGVQIWNEGAYRNQKGDKVMDMSRSDAVIKGVFQFNPSSNAQQGRDRSEVYHMKNMVAYKHSQFSTQLAEAIYQEDDERVDDLYSQMEEWNDRNAEQYNVDIDKIEAAAERRVDKKDFTSDERQKVPENLGNYLESRE